MFTKPVRRPSARGRPTRTVGPDLTPRLWGLVGSLHVRPDLLSDLGSDPRSSTAGVSYVTNVFINVSICPDPSCRTVHCDPSGGREVGRGSLLIGLHGPSPTPAETPVLVISTPTSGWVLESSPVPYSHSLRCISVGPTTPGPGSGEVSRNLEGRWEVRVGRGVDDRTVGFLYICDPCTRTY